MEYDLAICMGNSINFFPPDDLQLLFSKVAQALKENGSFLINSWTIAEIAYRTFEKYSESKIGDILFSNEIFFQLHPARYRVECTMTLPDGTKEYKTGIDYIYSLNELERMLNHSGLILEKVYSIPGKKEFTLEDPRAYIIVRNKRKDK
ncbi:MAG: hypothetical protein N2747_07750 [Chitinophagaceae bacterium]|nr:hypothetical protein [Chitinophagaceae bacterium]